MNKNNTAAYESATRGLIEKLNSMNLSTHERLQAKNFVLLFRDSFKLETVKYATFYPEIGDDYMKFPYDSYGFCKASSCSFVYLMNSSDWQLMYINEVWAHGPHYYVQHVPTKTVFDLTFDQYAYDGVEIPYFMGRPTKISKDANANKIMKRFIQAAGLDIAMARRKNSNRND